MIDLELEDLKSRRLKSMAQCQEYMASLDENDPVHPQEGEFAGRSAKQIDSSNSKELSLFRSYTNNS